MSQSCIKHYTHINFYFPQRSFQQSRQATTNTAPTFEDLTIDDSLPELQRLVKYAKSSIGLQR